MKDRFQEIIDIFEVRTSTTLGLVTLIVDILLFIAVLAILAKLIKGKIKISLYLTTIFTLGFIYLVSYVFELVLLTDRKSVV